MKRNIMKIPKLKIRDDFPMLIKQMGYKKICEVGVNRGDFLLVLAITIPDHLVGVDVWDKYDKEAYKNIPPYYKRYPHSLNKIWREKAQAWAEKSDLNIDIIVDFSVEAAKQFEDGYFDFVYIDADHSYKGVTEDLEAWYPKVRKGGMMAGHDYVNWRWRNGGKDMIRCKDGIDDFFKKHNRENDLMLTEEKKFKSFYLIR
jgi:predicted O-methyltransferase YrrM